MKTRCSEIYLPVSHCGKRRQGNVPLTTCSCTNTTLSIRGVWQTENRFGLVFKIPNHPKIWHPFRWFSNRNCVQSATQTKSDKITLLAFIVHQLQINQMTDNVIVTVY